MTTSDLVQTMIKKAAIAGTVVEQIGSMNEAVQYTVNLCLKKKMKTITGIGLGADDWKQLSKLCEKQKIALLEPPLRDHADAFDIALTRADSGIAETGTLMLYSDSEDRRMATMLSKIHVAILSAEDIKSDTADIADELDTVLKSDTPSYSAFITGPSRTADIERVLAIGVHGPLELHLLLLKEDAI